MSVESAMPMALMFLARLGRLYLTSMPATKHWSSADLDATIERVTPL
jgi:hypothetical protein